MEKNAEPHAPIPLVDLRTQIESIRPEIDAAIARVVDSARFVGGDEVADFEREWAGYCGAEAAVATSSGTTAWHLLLEAHGIGPGDEVIIPSHTFFATVEGIVQTGATPVFGEIDLDTYCMHPIAAEAMITPRTRAICPVHLYGRLADMRGFRELADQHNLLLFEDAAQAHGAGVHTEAQGGEPLRGRRAGTLSDGAVYSFFPGKNLGAFGDAGAIVTENADVAAHCRALANHGRRGKYEHDRCGYNYRMDALQAAILRAKLLHLDAWTQKRREAAECYNELLAGIDGITLPSIDAGPGHAWHLYVIRTERRDELAAHLAEHNIATGIHYPIPCHLQPAMAGHFQAEEGLLQATELAASQILSLPIYPEIKEADQNQIAKIMKLAN